MNLITLRILLSLLHIKLILTPLKTSFFMQNTIFLCDSSYNGKLFSLLKRDRFERFAQYVFVSLCPRCVIESCNQAESKNSSSPLENRRGPASETCVCLSALIKYIRPVFVSRSDQDSRRKTVEEIRRRAHSGGEWPQVPLQLTSFKEVCT